MQRSCAVCGGAFEAAKPNATYCGATCRKRASRGAVTTAPAEVDADRPVSGLVDAVLAELEVLAKVDSVTGQHALELAHRVASAPAMSAGVAALSKELSRVLADARSSSTVVVDPVDELGARRDAKLKRAAG